MTDVLILLLCFTLFFVDGVIKSHQTSTLLRKALFVGLVGTHRHDPSPHKPPHSILTPITPYYLKIVSGKEVHRKLLRPTVNRDCAPVEVGPGKNFGKLRVITTKS